MKLSELWRRLRGVMKRREIEDDLNAEMDEHVSRLEHDFEAHGMTAEEAGRAARLRFGNPVSLREESRARWGFPRLESIVQDLRFAARLLRRSPGFTTVAVLTLALGIGASTAIFSIVNTVLVKPLPFRDPGRLVNLWESNPQNPGDDIMPVAPADFQDWRSRTHSFAGIGATYDVQKSLTGAGEPEALIGYAFSSNVFDVLGVAPLLGRTFTADEDRPGADHVVVLGYSLWKRKFGGDPGIVGKNILLDAKSYSVVGVMPPGFAYPPTVEFWVPAALKPEEAASRKLPLLRLIARVKPGVTLRAASADLANVAAQLQREYPDTNAQRTAKLVPVRDMYVGDIQPALLALMGAVGFLLLIACANLANLLLARGAGRRREFAVRVALGASRRRLVRQLLSESLLLAIFGGLAGLLLAYASRGFLLHLFPNDIANLHIPHVESIPMQGGVVLFAVLVSVITGVLFGVLPALNTPTGDAYERLKDAGRSSVAGRERTRSVLVVVEMGLSLVLLAGAGLMIKTLLRIEGASLGINPDHVLAAEVLLPRTKYPKLEDRNRFLNETMRRLQALPGVKSAGAVAFLPLSGFWNETNFTIEGQAAAPNNMPQADFNIVTPEYFRTMDVPLLAGRDFRAGDSATAPQVVLINQSLAQQFWPHESPIGKRIVPDPSMFPRATWEIVGVVGDVKHFGVTEPTHPTLFRPFAQESFPLLSFVIRTEVPPGSLAKAAQQAIWSVDAEQPIFKVITMDEAAAESVTLRKISMVLLSLFAGLSVLLALVGLFGVLSYLVTQRTQEIGVRMALGARPRDISQLVLGHGLRMTMVGIVLGTLAALGLTRLLTTLLFGVQPEDPATFVAVAVLLAAVALLACYLPARRASKLDPMVALRYE